MLLAGSARVQVIGEGGREALLYCVRPGQSCLLTTCCTLSVAAYPGEGLSEAPVHALAISRPAFDRAMESAPAFHRIVFATLGARVADVITCMEEVAFRRVGPRLAT
jgi:CRP/FNR family transcriptional regulator